MTVYTPAFRVFVFGQEVTDDVTSLRIGHNDNRAPSMCEFTLANRIQLDSGPGIGDDLDRYIVNVADIDALVSAAAATGFPEPDLRFGDTVRLVERHLERIRDAQLQARRLAANRVPDLVKRRVLAAKVAATQKVPVTAALLGGAQEPQSVEAVLAYTGLALRYPIHCGDCIFHSNDPVRVFLRDPRPGSDRWYYGFTGFVTDWVDSVSVNNERLVTIRAEDPLRILRYARVSTSYGVFDIAKIKQVQDAATRSLYKEAFNGLSLEDYVFTVIFGSAPVETTSKTRIVDGDRTFPGILVEETRYSVNAPAGVSRTKSADTPTAFDLARSLVVYVGDKPSDADRQDANSISAVVQARTVDLGTSPQVLGLYHALIDAEVRVSDLTSMLAGEVSPGSSPGTGLGEGGVAPEVSIGEVISRIGEHPELYPCDGGRVFMLLPNNLGGGVSARVLLKDLVDSIELKTGEFTNRLAMLFNMLDRLQFSLWATPRGDIAVEMPLFDFRPVDFGEAPVKLQDLVGRLPDASRQLWRSVVSDVAGGPGGFAEDFRIPRGETLSWQRTFTDERVRTAVFGSWSIIQSLQVGGMQDLAGIPRAVIALTHLVPQFGVRFEEPDPLVAIATEEGARVYAALKLNQYNAEAKAATVEVLPRVQFVPNRPVEFLDDRRFVGTTRAADLAIDWPTDMTVSLSLNSLRAWSGQYDDRKRPIYEPIGGFASTPLNYALMLQPRLAPQSTAAPAAPAAPPAAKAKRAPARKSAGTSTPKRGGGRT